LGIGDGKKSIIKKKKPPGLEFMNMKMCGFLMNITNMTVQMMKKKQQIPKKMKNNVGVVYTMSLIKWLISVVDIKET
jgi:hypothetical protein